MNGTSRETTARGGLLWGPPAYVVRTPWGAGSGLLAAVAIVGVATIAVMLLAVVLTDGPAPDALVVDMRLVATWQALVIVLTLAASTLSGGRAGDVLALQAAPGGWRVYAGAFLAMVAFQLLLTAVQAGIMQHDVTTDLHPFVGHARGPDWLLTAAAVGIGAPLSEELLFRGFLLSALARTPLRFWGAALVTAALWTVMHAGYSSVGLVEVFLVGVFLSWLLWRTGSLRVAIFCHALYNSLVLLALRFVDLPAGG